MVGGPRPIPPLTRRSLLATTRGMPSRRLRRNLMDAIVRWSAEDEEFWPRWVDTGRKIEAIETKLKAAAEQIERNGDAIETLLVQLRDMKAGDRVGPEPPNPPS
jgi:hypothetical protein